jgi:hypothetical protein
MDKAKIPGLQIVKYFRLFIFRNISRRLALPGKRLEYKDYPTLYGDFSGFACGTELPGKRSD